MLFIITAFQIACHSQITIGGGVLSQAYEDFDFGFTDKGINGFIEFRTTDLRSTMFEFYGIRYKQHAMSNKTRTEYSFSILNGFTAFPAKRVQLPFYIGGGFNFRKLDGKFDEYYLHLILKPMLKIYILDVFGVYGSISGRVGLSNYGVAIALYPEVGVLFSF